MGNEGMGNGRLNYTNAFDAALLYCKGELHNIDLETGFGNMS